jgi:membrane-associated protease RseP (regulator of RpoE activity)
VPKWVAVAVGVIVAALVFGGIGYAIGDSSSGSDSASSRPATNVPGFGGGNRQLPGPFGGNGSGNGNGNGNSNGNGKGDDQTTGTAFLGVSISDGNGGALVTQVQSNSAAAHAGIQSGDVITKVDTTPITSAADLAAAIQQHDGGDDISVTYTRNGSSATANVTLGTRQAQNS